MNTPDLTIRPCEAQPAPRRADRVDKYHGLTSPCLLPPCHGLTSPCLRPRRTRPSPASSSIRHRTSHIRHSPAFTLVELTIVLSIIVIVSAIALPRYWSSIARYRVDLAARRLAADLSLAQTRARTTGQFRNVVFAAGTSAYVLSEETSFNNATGPQSVDLGTDPYLIAFGSFSATDSGRRVTFDGFGQPAQGLTITLLASGHQRTVTVDRYSGSIIVTTP